MKHVKILGLAALAALAVAAFAGAGTAAAKEAVELCKVNETPCPEASLYPLGTVIKGESAFGETHLQVTILGSERSVTCKSTVEGETTENWSASEEEAQHLYGEITSLRAQH